MAKRKKRSRAAEDAEETVETQERLPPVTRRSDEPPEKKHKWINKQRVMIFASRGITFRDRHLMLNLRTLLPHSKPESKMEKKDPLVVINEICDMKNCNKCLYFENKKRKDLYLWASNVPNGPSVKFLVENVHTMEELKMTGNCLKGTRPLLSFDQAFNENPFSKLMKELLSQIFGTPRYHPKSQPFVDHVFTFSLLDHRIWFRNYQIVEETGALVEIGPRFVLNPIKVFESSFGGTVIYSNPNYVTPSQHRRSLKLAAAGKYKERKEARASLKHRIAEGPAPSNPLDDIFQTVPPEKAKGRDKLLFRRKK
ncbi:ribosome biogenesis protein BRX1 homolog [Dermacentor andersoni]|uniref:ribosome biogenesis protein BRX1 homolog n=1 Tax=Dermacentor andersoni TaxID=34620 RepID=UPI002155DCA0|nr:ribosome biogenesis protein BRX1 homolog [Dermacentor andersoni]